MKLRDQVMRLGVPWFVEGPASRRSYVQLYRALEQSGPQIVARIRKSRSSQTGKTIRHIIGIERWGQRRLRVALGEPLLMDGHHPYKPPEGLTHDRLAEEFQATRQQTLALVKRLEDLPVGEKIPHNSLGPLSVKGWLFYLNLHADLESRRLR
ncbi:DinB family protein [Meiothermus hypogaeus]|nr:DinB family protein [Meiothermus hypogaeus]